MGLFALLLAIRAIEGKESGVPEQGGGSYPFALAQEGQIEAGVPCLAKLSSSIHGPQACKI